MSSGARPKPPGSSRIADAGVSQPVSQLLRRLLLVSVLLSPALPGCTGQDAEQLYEIARLEERQNNRAHARELYEQIVRDFPDSPYAERARQRLEGLDAAP